MKKQWRWLVFIVFIACFGISNTMVIADNVGSTENTSLSGSPKNKTDNKNNNSNISCNYFVYVFRQSFKRFSCN